MGDGRGERQAGAGSWETESYETLKKGLTSFGKGTKSASLTLHSSKTFQSSLFSVMECPSASLLFPFLLPGLFNNEAFPTPPQISTFIWSELKSVHSAKSCFDMGSTVKDGFVEGR
jgi:hypothetical protein